MNILPRYSGILVGDHYAVNESFQGRVAFCNAHTVRTAKGAIDLRKNSKAKDYIEERKLINLLLTNVEGHLMFAKESLVPFTNNNAKRGLRPIKTKMKVIGSFRIQENANGFCNALSIIQTAQKQKLNPCKILGQIASGQSKVFAFQN